MIPLAFQFDNLSGFLTMGGHGVYVWTAYAVSLVVLSMLVVAPLRRSRKRLLELGRRLQQEEAE
ncbi:MAG TPA: heme exporter protein CcmD [Porticoccaceae bacterium]|nr:heme exporter protein CcmD [Porticoccaceae bacterium]